MSSIILVEFDQLFLDLSWIWLNDSELKRMTNTPDFTREFQKVWFKDINSKTNYLIWGIMHNNIPIGVCGLKNITNFDCEYWGYIGEKNFWGKGFGTVILKLMEEKAKIMKLQSIWLKVVNDNERAITLYNKNGYSKESNNSRLIKMRKSI